MVLFSKYGAVDSVSSYPSRSYAFVYFKRVEDAKKALEALHGTYLRGNSLKIEFARPVCSALRALLGFTDCSLYFLIDLVVLCSYWGNYCFHVLKRRICGF